MVISKQDKKDKHVADVGEQMIPRGFSRRDDGSFDFELESGGYLSEGLRSAWEFSKLNGCSVNYSTNSAGKMQINPDMELMDAMNVLVSHLFSKEKKYHETNQEVPENAPESIGLEDFYLLDSRRRSGTNEIMDFCAANGIDAGVLRMYYDLAVKYAKDNSIAFEKLPEVAKLFGLPMVITKENLPKLKEQLVLTPDDPRVAAVEDEKAHKVESAEELYARRRLEKLGVEPYSGPQSGDSKSVIANAIAQAKKSNRSVSFFLNNPDIKGLFVVSPGHAPASFTYSDLVKNADQKRWDKPIEQQKKEEEFDRFKDYQFRKKIFELYGTASEEVCYAHKRLEKSGIKPFSGEYDGRVDDIFAAAMKQAKKSNNKVAVNLCSGVIKGLFVVSPDQSADDPKHCQAVFDNYVQNQDKLRWDKPIEQQKAEEKVAGQESFAIGNIGVNIKKGNIATEESDCIVVPEFNSCASRGGVGGAIEDAGMSAGLDAYDAVVKSKTLQFGDSVITQSGKPGVKLAHVVTAGAGKDEQMGAVNKAIFNTLVAANQQGIKSVAIPELGTGIIGSLTQEQSAKAIFGAVHSFSQQYPSSKVKDVSFVVYRGSTDPAKKVLKEGSYVASRHNEKGEKWFDPIAFAKGMQEMLERK